jgi:OOP family OmpA-OmpF porin
VNRWTLTDDAKAQLEEMAKSTGGLDRYVIEVQGFTDKTGSDTINERLSQQRAQEVARYLANEYKIPVRSISLLGSGYAQPVADDKTREGRKLNRRVEVRLFVPEASTASKSLTAKSGAEQ